MSHVLLTQLSNDNQEQKIIVRIDSINYSNHPADSTIGTYLNLTSGGAIKVIESAEEIHGRIKAILYGES
tara:strand:+ start:16543 stop:16752 length:210 start_codon:yes stop_codon:yes gene_type:complete